MEFFCYFEVKATTKLKDSPSFLRYNKHKSKTIERVAVDDYNRVNWME
ncbi:hypothetical protein HMPREF0557_00136 [Listeria innocua ATCC 33091]|uniref:Uncharacterized protein n=1 Tax=Listeria innocua ATCC 33091 TaxID=1002366 RepID=A0AB72ZDF1_LISIO|nr:hypothetical protein HMPREF0557_00136 [Listeria innocua ATCC 33091]